MKNESNVQYKIMMQNQFRKCMVVLTMFWLPFMVNAQCGCTHIIPLDSRVYTIDGATFIGVSGQKGVKPGDKVCFATGIRPDVLIKNMNGTATNPITITNMCDGQVVISRKNAGRLIYIGNSSFIHVTGSGNVNVQYGIEITAGIMGIDFRDFTTNVEGDHLYIHDITYAGIIAKTDPTCDPATWRGAFTMHDVSFHDNHIKTTLGEGFYIGDSHYNTTFPVTCNGVVTQQLEHDVIGVKVFNNLLENIGRDGIQIGSATDCHIYHNVIRGFGVTNEYGQQSGIQVNPGTRTECYDNIVDTGTGFGIFAGGRGGSHFYNNTVSNCLQGAVLVASYVPYDTASFTFDRNALLNNKVYGFYDFSEQSKTISTNNVITSSDPAFLFLRVNNSKVKFIESGNTKLLYSCTPLIK